jgi:hypothetical protein
MAYSKMATPFIVWVTEFVRINANVGRTRATLKRPSRFKKAVKQLFRSALPLACKNSCKLV